MRYSTFFKVLACVSFLVFGNATLRADSPFSDEELASSSSMNDLDAPPKPVKQSSPSVPPELQGIKASVQIGFIIDEKGNVQKARIVQSSNVGFNEISLRCVRDWQFEPGSKGGQPVKVRVVVPLRFK